MLTNRRKSAPELGLIITACSSLGPCLASDGCVLKGFFLQPIVVRAEINLAGLLQYAGLTGQAEDWVFSRCSKSPFRV